MPSAPSAPPPITRIITLAEGMTVKDLADKLDVRVKDVLAKLLMKRMMMTINSTVDVETAKDIARDSSRSVSAFWPGWAPNSILWRGWGGSPRTIRRRSRMMNSSRHA